MSKINSFSQNMGTVVAQSANTLSLMTALQNAITKNDTFVTYDYTGNDGTTIQYQLPSYDSVVNRLRAVEESINSLNSGKGTINLTDGSRRTISLSSIPHTPGQITGLADPTEFTIDSNWFFEELMFPGAQVEVNLTDQIEDTADRVRVVRIILNSNDDNARNIWDSDLSVNSYDYVSLKTLLQNNNIPYYEDEDTIQLPLVSNKVSGSFQITDDPELIDNNVWYKLDTITYSTISSNGLDQGQNNVLSVGDQLSFSDSIFEIVGIDQNNLKVRLKRINGVQNPGVYSMLEYYEDPFEEKIARIRFGAHEYNIIYFKGIAENYNLLSDKWSTPVKFSSDDLVLAGSTGLQQTTFATYYAQYIVDWGSKMIAEAKERKITAWYGSTPNTPTINADDFRVVQINTQINAAIDTTDVKNTAAEIESVKSQISSLKSTIAAQKTDLQSAVNLYTYNSIQQQIATNTTDLTNLQKTYSTLVDSFQTIVKENSAITTVPKYHIRGFFPIPEYKYQDAEETIAEEIIGFDIAYRYIKEDSTATQLNTFTYTAADGTEVTGTYTDWVIVSGPLKQKRYDEDLQRYVWKAENVADGTETNINQIDIAISKGEKVEIKVRAISEAGYPENPLRSAWSNTVVVDFPSTLATSNEIADLITMVNDDALNITINNTLDSIGVTTHLDDTIPNSNSVNGMYYKHVAKNIAYEESGTTAEGTTVVNSISLQDKISQLFSKMVDNGSVGLQNSADISKLDKEMQEKHTIYEQNFKDIGVKIEVINSSVNDNAKNIDDIRKEEGVVQAKKYIFKNNDNSEAVALSSMNQSELFVLDYDGKTTDASLANVHAKDYYIHRDGNTAGSAGTQESLTSLIDDVSLHAVENSSNLAIANASIEDISTRIVNIAYLKDVSIVNAKADENRNLIDGIKDGSNIIADEVFLGTDETKLASNKTAGALYVFEGQSEEQMGIVHAEDINIHTGGYVTGTIISMASMNDTINDHSSNLKNLNDSLTNVNDIVDQITYKNDSGWELRGETAIISAKLSAATVESKEFVMTNGMPFYAYNGINTAQLVDGHFKNIYIHRTGEKSSDQMSLYSAISDISTSARDSSYWVNNVRKFIIYDESNPTGIEIDSCDSINCNNASFGSIELDNMIRLDSGDSDMGLFVYDIEHNIIANAHFANAILHQNGNADGESKNVWDILQWVEDVSNGWLNDTSTKLAYVFTTKNSVDVSIRGKNVIVDGGQILLRGSAGGYINLNPNGEDGLRVNRGYDKNGNLIDGKFYCSDLIASGKVQAREVYIDTSVGSLELKEYLNETYTKVTDLVANIKDNKNNIDDINKDIKNIKDKINEIIGKLSDKPALIE